jgi:hypothetical protein
MSAIQNLTITENNLIYAKMVKVCAIQNLTIKNNNNNLCQNGKGTLVNACPRVEPRSAYFGSALP